MAAQSTLKLAPVDPGVYTAICHARHPPRRLWMFLIRLLLQYAVTVPVVVLATPFVILRNLVPFLRKHPAWTFKTGVSSTLVRLTITCMGLIRFAPAPHDESGWLQGDSVAGGGLLAYMVQLLAWRSYGQRIWGDIKTLPHLGHLHGKRLDEVWVAPPPADWLRGILAVRNPAKPLDEQQSFTPLYRGRPMIQPEFAKRRVKCYWYLRRGRKIPPVPEEGYTKRTGPVLLYTHGGAGVSFSAGDNFMGASLAAVLARTADIDVFTVDYDLAPYAKYPTTVVQLFAAWLYLVADLGYHPSQIFFGGDSYGGFATLLFERYLRDVWPYLEPPSAESFQAANPNKEPEWINESVSKFTALLGGSEVRAPARTAGLILFSPWLYTQEDAAMFPARATAMAHDIVTMQYLRWGTDCLEMTHKDIERNGLSSTSPWINPVFLSSDELAILPPTWIGNGGVECLLDEGTYFVRRMQGAGGDVEHHVEVGMVHDFYTIPFEISNAKKHYRLLNPWIKTHFEAAQRRTRTSPSTFSSSSATLLSMEDDIQRVAGLSVPEGSSSATLSQDVEANPLNSSLTQSGIVINSLPNSDDNGADAQSTIASSPPGHTVDLK